MRRLTLPLALVLPASILIGGCSGPAESPAIDPVATDLQNLVHSVVAENEVIHGAALAVISPTRGLDWEGAAGLADPGAGIAMTPANPVRIASNTKTYVAAAVLRLVEEGRLDMDTVIADHLPDQLIDLLVSDGYDPSSITIRHLLTHTGGLYDHGAAAEYTEAIIADPQHHWTPVEQITAMVEWGDKLGAPGEVYSYSDSGYILLGVILERTTGQGLAASVRELVGLDRLGLDSTWWEILEPAPEGVADRAHQFLGDLDVYDFVPYFDLYGGGGIATTVGDLARFFDELFRGGVYHDRATVDIMLSTLDVLAAAPGAGERALPPGAYRMGVWVLGIEGHTCYIHSGFWGTLTVHVPELDLTFAATVNQNQCGPAFERIQVETIRIVEAAETPG